QPARCALACASRRERARPRRRDHRTRNRTRRRRRTRNGLSRAGPVLRRESGSPMKHVRVSETPDYAKPFVFAFAAGEAFQLVPSAIGASSLCGIPNADLVAVIALPPIMCGRCAQLARALA